MRGNNIYILPVIPILLSNYNCFPIYCVYFLFDSKLKFRIQLLFQLNALRCACVFSQINCKLYSINLMFTVLKTHNQLDKYIYFLWLGTGTNACYMEETTRIAKWQGDKDSMRQVIINMSHYYGFFAICKAFTQEKIISKEIAHLWSLDSGPFIVTEAGCKYSHFCALSFYSLSIAIHIEIFNLKTIFF